VFACYFPNPIRLTVYRPSLSTVVIKRKCTTYSTNALFDPNTTTITATDYITSGLVYSYTLRSTPILKTPRLTLSFLQSQDAFFMTFFSVFDVPVFWPILLVYWCMLLFMTMKQQIKHMIKHKYVPISWGKKQYGKKGGMDAGSAPIKDSK
jgi:hypothetical protein